MVTVGAAATDWANDGLFGDGYHLLGIGSAAYEEASEEFGDFPAIIEAFENGEFTYTVQDEETLEVSEPVEFTESDVVAAKAMVEKYGEVGPSPDAYGIWIPGVPAVIESVLDAMECADWLKGLILDGIVGGVGAVLFAASDAGGPHRRGDRRVCRPGRGLSGPAVCPPGFPAAGGGHGPGSGAGAARRRKGLFPHYGPRLRHRPAVF